jgi:pimeloyl-ACP methyl ester carboxylesterase
MTMCKAFYSQQRYVSAEEVTQVVSYTGSTDPSKCPRFLVIHGNEDGIFPVVQAQKLVHAIQCGVQRRMTNRPNSNEDVVQFHVVDDASHQVFQERPDIVASLIWDFISPILPNSS